MCCQKWASPDLCLEAIMLSDKLMSGSFASFAIWCWHQQWLVIEWCHLLQSAFSHWIFSGEEWTQFPWNSVANSGGKQQWLKWHCLACQTLALVAALPSSDAFQLGHQDCECELVCVLFVGWCGWPSHRHHVFCRWTELIPHTASKEWTRLTPSKQKSMPQQKCIGDCESFSDFISPSSTRQNKGWKTPKKTFCNRLQFLSVAEGRPCQQEWEGNKAEKWKGEKEKMVLGERGNMLTVCENCAMCRWSPWCFFRKRSHFSHFLTQFVNQIFLCRM